MNKQKLFDYSVDFSRLLTQRHGRRPHPWLALGYALIQSMGACLPGRVPVVETIHEGLTRQLIGCDPTRRTGRYSWEQLRTVLFIVPGLWVKESDVRSRVWMLRGCGWRAGWEVVRQLWRLVKQRHPSAVAELAYRAVPYAVLFRQTQATTYLTTTMSQCPESPAVPVANAMGIRTILWAFGDQYVLPTPTEPTQWVVPAAQSPSMSEIHLWTDTSKRLWQENSRVSHRVSPGPRLIVDGPRMLGKKPAAFPPSRLVGVADTPAKRGAARYGIVTAAWVEAFYRDLLACAEALPSVRWVVKAKYADRDVAVAPSKRALCRLPQVEELDPDGNPWVLLERCGLLIGLPYSSMGTAALSVGRTLCYYDPTGEAACYPNATLRAHRMIGRAALRERLMAWQQEGVYA